MLNDEKKSSAATCESANPRKDGTCCSCKNKTVTASSAATSSTVPTVHASFSPRFHSHE